MKFPISPDNPHFPRSEEIPQEIFGAGENVGTARPLQSAPLIGQRGYDVTEHKN